MKNSVEVKIAQRFSLSVAFSIAKKSLRKYSLCSNESNDYDIFNFIAVHMGEAPFRVTYWCTKRLFG
jgi:hypothetical protein